MSEQRASDWRIEGPIDGQSSLRLGQFDLAAHGYVVEEFFLSGTARTYRDDQENDETASYRTRLLVCRPADAAQFGGTVVVEWCNVSGGGDGAPDWMFMHRHILRTRSTWVGVSAQKVGVDGGSRVGGGMRQVDPERYGDLSHPGDAFSFDINSHAGLAIRNDPRLLGGPTPTVVISVGESQSAMFLVGYINRVDPLAQVYDAFLVHGRGARAAGRSRTDPPAADGDPIRSPRVPTITVQSETDVVGMQGFRARCEDSETSRFWEIAGAAHFDSWGLTVSGEDDGTLPIERLAELASTTTGPMGMATAEPINSGPQQHYVLQAALAHLAEWAVGGAPAPHAPFLDLATNGDGDAAALQLDDDGIVRGGIRTPWVDVPTAVLSGLGASGEGFGGLFGVTRPFDAATLSKRYPGGVDDYLERFTASAEAACEAGFLLRDDLPEILALAKASWTG